MGDRPQSDGNRPSSLQLVGEVAASGAVVSGVHAQGTDKLPSSFRLANGDSASDSFVCTMTEHAANASMACLRKERANIGEEDEFCALESSCEDDGRNTRTTSVVGDWRVGDGALLGTKDSVGLTPREYRAEHDE